MLIDKNYKGLRKLENGDYLLEGDIRIDEFLEIELNNWLRIEGNIESTQDIRSNVPLRVSGGIRADILEVNGKIEAGGNIDVCTVRAKWGIKARKINAGGDIEAGKDIIVSNSIIASGGIKSVNGSVVSYNSSIIAGNNIVAYGLIKAGGSIKAGLGIDAGCAIRASAGIVSGLGIKAGLGITAKWISAKLKIFAGICWWKNTDIDEKTIKVKEVKNGEIACGNLRLQ